MRVAEFEVVIEDWEEAGTGSRPRVSASGRRRLERNWTEVGKVQSPKLSSRLEANQYLRQVEFKEAED